MLFIRLVSCGDESSGLARDYPAASAVVVRCFQTFSDIQERMPPLAAEMIFASRRCDWLA